MNRYFFPVGMRYTTLEERKQFYAGEFELKGVSEWFSSGIDKTRFAVIIGRHTKIFSKKYKYEASTTILLNELSDLPDLRCQIIEFLPEAVYYDRNIYDENGIRVGQEVAFDLDPENITCPIHGSLEDKMKRQQGLSFCEIESAIVKKEAMGLYDFLEKRFKNLRAVYTGRGFHIHVFDPEAYGLNTQTRVKLAKQVKDSGFHIDEWITSGEYRLIRLPYSLNGLVSRIVLPLKRDELENFDAIHDKRCVPRFIARRFSSNCKHERFI